MANIPGLALLKRVARTQPAVFKALRGARLALGSVGGARAVPGIRGRVHYNDMMYAGDAAHYTAVGRGVADRIERALATAGLGWADVQPVLEIGPNYGRVVRALLDHIPADRLHVSDILPEAVRFCAAEFGVTAWPEVSDPGFAPAEPFGLVILISVFTHLSDSEIARILKVIERNMAAGGVLFFTSHGFEAARRIGSSEHAAKADAITAVMASGGSHYIRAAHWDADVGTAWHHPDRIRAIVGEATGLVELDFEAAGLDGHQDVFVWRKPGPATA